MTILYDYQAFMHKVGGVPNCFAELIRHLPSDVSWEIGVRESDNVHLRDANIIPRLRKESLNGSNLFCKRHFFGKVHLFNFLNENFDKFPSSEHINRRYSIELLKAQQFDIFHPTFFDPYFLPYIGNKPFVLTLHDFITDKFHSPLDKQAVDRKTLASKASHFIAVSEKTKEDAIEILQIPEEKISVVYHGVSVPEHLTCKRVVEEKYFLFVGRRNGYKNFVPMVKAMAKFLNQHKDYKLVCTAGTFTKEELLLFKELNIDNQVQHIFASYEQLLSLYKYAEAFVYPSLYEGFGIPILEAYAMGCPVMLNRTSCFPEIAGDAALYFDLNETRDTFGALLDEFYNMSDERKQQLLERQEARLQLYSWQKSAEQLASIYKSILQY